MKHKNNVAEYRKTIGKTQKQLATDTEVSEISIQNIETGKQEPKISLAKKIVKALDKTVEEVFPDYEEKRPNNIGVLDGQGN